MGETTASAAEEVGTCAVCGGTAATPAWTARDTLLGGPGIFSYVRCDTCSTLRMSPRPPFEARRQAFADEYPLFDWALGRKQADPGERISRFSAQIGQVVRRQRPGRLLDVGCGDGYFMLGMERRGWEVKGIELHEGVAAYARERLGLDVVAGAEHEVEWGGPYDCVTLFGVIEDVDDPGALIERCFANLSDGGLLVVQTHNIDSWEARFFKGDWFNTEAPRHVWHFTPSTLERLLEKHRFRQVDLLHYGSSYVTERSIENRRGREFPGTFLDRFLRKAVITPAARLLPRIGQGIMIESYCRKVTV
ncbi:MAG: class I SAM-dependent methyltransferase [Gaiellales bacterium]|nr:MAG: class I SAM-dependent methyltransferase [Gaiellales bacterium]